MQGVLLEEEQISLLGKMLYYSADHLTARERETYDHLVESLLRKVNQLRAMEKRGNRPGPSAPSSSVAEAQYQVKKNALMNLRPEELVKVFIDSWNKQDFETEFFSLAHCFPSTKRKTDNVQEYVLNRMKKYSDRLMVGPVMKKLVEVSSAPVHGNKTTVFCIEIHKMPEKDLSLQREYDLIFEDGAWRIADFHTVKSHQSEMRGKQPA
ncbi:MAG: hypothetical protein ABIH23_10930 [bacterium]